MAELSLIEVLSLFFVFVIICVNILYVMISYTHSEGLSSGQRTGLLTINIIGALILIITVFLKVYSSINKRRIYRQINMNEQYYDDDNNPYNNTVYKGKGNNFNYNDNQYGDM